MEILDRNTCIAGCLSVQMWHKLIGEQFADSEVFPKQSFVFSLQNIVCSMKWIFIWWLRGLFLLIHIAVIALRSSMHCVPR